LHRFFAESTPFEKFGRQGSFIETYLQRNVDCVQKFPNKIRLIEIKSSETLSYESVKISWLSKKCLNLPEITLFIMEAKSLIFIKFTYSPGLKPEIFCGSLAHFLLL
jgi:hypothetical protein